MQKLVLFITFLMPVCLYSKSTIHFEDFNNCASISWTAVAGSTDSEAFDDWSCKTFSGRTYMEIYDGDGNNDEDWLISPSFNLDVTNEEYFSFEYDNASDISGLTLFYSTNFSGTYNSTAIDAANWIAIPLDLYDIDNDAYTSNFTFQRAISLNNISGTNVYLAFRFISTSSTQGWSIDNTRIIADYYEDAVNSIGTGGKCATLKTVLHQLVRGHDMIYYTSSNYDVWDAIYATDKRWNDDNTAIIVYDMYSDNPNGVEPYEFTLGADRDIGMNAGMESVYYNREHVFPKSWWGGGTSMFDTAYTDIHHIVPSDQNVNSRKSNHPLANTNSPTHTTDNGCKVGPSAISGYTGTVFEPIDEYKGDFARMLFYMLVRYEPNFPSWQANYVSAMNSDTYTPFDSWYLENLLCWHENDPVSTKELDRNNAVYSIQGNRNPFIDHPEYAFFIWGTCGNLGCPSTLPVEMASFTGKATEQQVSLLEWHTLSEVGTSHFEVEHSLNAQHFESIYRTSAQGAEQVEYHYQYEHDNAAFGMNYYRIKSVDWDGSYEYSQIVGVRHENDNSIDVYPTLADDMVHIQSEQKGIHIQLYDFGGNICLQTSVSDESHLEIFVGTLPSGYYILRCESGSLVETKRIFVK